MIYIKLFWSMFQIGLFSIGGGYASIPLFQRQIVELNGWLTEAEFADVVTIAEMTPGPIAINAATFVGVRVAGIFGALTATLSCVLPSCIIVLLLAKLYYAYRDLDAIGFVLSGLRPAVVAMIASAGVGMLLLVCFPSGGAWLGVGQIEYVGMLLFAAAMIALRKWRVNPLYVMGGAGAIGLIAYALLGL